MKIKKHQNTGVIGIGPKSTEKLNAIGIFTRSDLERVGSVNTYIQLKRVFPNVTLNFLYAMEAILMDVHWTKLPKDVKARLKEEVSFF
ncbi:TfoX/Sxy family DNA transformation protein [bacterium]|nr:TfoX/Sxy family DNA transformation protein [bacterium]